MRRTLILLQIILGGALSLRAQNRTEDSLARQKDLRDVAGRVFNRDHKAKLPTSEARFHNSPFPAVGYTLVTGIAAVFSDRMDFHTGDSTGKITDILSSVTYSQYNQIIAQSYADIWAGHDKYNVIADWRYMKYPSTTFGLGGHTQYTDGYTIDFSYIKLHTTVLRFILPNLYAGLGYYYDYFYKIQEVNPPPGEQTSFEKYGLTQTELGSGPVARILYDSRDNPANALSGWYGSILYHPSFTALGSQTNWATMQIDIRKYVKLRKDGRNVLALWNFDWVSVGGKTPYLLLPSTGWDDQFNTGRGYIQGRYRGSDMTYLEMEDRFAISRNGLFGGVVFANVESFKRNLATSFNNDIPGWGAGMRIKLNKHSNTNICVDYGFGLQGSQGIAVNVGEVF
jgi:outer membrane protein assembly factor BamA